MAETLITCAVDFDRDTHTYRRDGVVLPSVTQILGAVGLSRDWQAASPTVQARAAAKREVGVRVHDACAQLDRGRLSLGELDDALFGYVWAWEQYVRQRKVTEWRLIEQPLAHPTLAYAGTPDRVGVTEDGQAVVIDIKTGDPTDAAADLQTAGYALLVDGATIAPIRGLQRESVHLRPDGTFALHPYHDMRRDCGVFRAAVAVYFALPPTRRTR